MDSELEEDPEYLKGERRRDPGHLVERAQAYLDKLMKAGDAIPAMAGPADHNFPPPPYSITVQPIRNGFVVSGGVGFGGPAPATFCATRDEVFRAVVAFLMEGMPDRPVPPQSPPPEPVSGP